MDFRYAILDTTPERSGRGLFNIGRFWRYRCLCVRVSLSYDRKCSMAITIIETEYTEVRFVGTEVSQLSGF